MSTETLRTEVHPEELSEIVESVFRTMLDLELRCCSTPWFPDGERLTAAVHLTGTWNGAVLLECSRDQARLFAERFTGEPQSQVNDVVRDVLGELANMIGGNLKCVLVAGIGLSMPSVVDGSDYSVRVCRAVVKDRLAFCSSEGTIWVTALTTRDTSAAPKPM